MDSYSSSLIGLSSGSAQGLTSGQVPDRAAVWGQHIQEQIPQVLFVCFWDGEDR